jgi:hypothetical protein
MIKKTLLLLISAFCLLSIFSCAALKHGIAFLKTPNNFALVGNNVKVENKNDEQFAEKVSQVYLQLIDSVEIKHFHKFICPPVAYVFNTKQSFCKYTGSKYPGPRAYANKAIFISPRLKDSKDWNEIIYHELTHVILFQHLGLYHYIIIPIWFHEGLATLFSNGGGSGDVSDSAAIREILNGDHFYPVACENPIFPKSFSNKNGRPWMQYRQSMLFVKFLKEGKEKKFGSLLNSIYSKQSFSKSIKTSYGMTVSELWDEFLKELRENRNQSSAPEEKNAPNTDSRGYRQCYPFEDKDQARVSREEKI